MRKIRMKLKQISSITARGTETKKKEKRNENQQNLAETEIRIAAKTKTRYTRLGSALKVVVRLQSLKLAGWWTRVERRERRGNNGSKWRQTTNREGQRVMYMMLCVVRMSWYGVQRAACEWTSTEMESSWPPGWPLLDQSSRSSREQKNTRWRQNKDAAWTEKAAKRKLMCALSCFGACHCACHCLLLLFVCCCFFFCFDATYHQFLQGVAVVSSTFVWCCWLHG